MSAKDRLTTATTEDDESVIAIRSEADLNLARMIAREACKLIGLRGYMAQRVVTAVSELARNIARYVGEGHIRFRIDPTHELLCVVAEDRGSGIPNLDEILAGNHRSKSGMGRGLLGVKKLADEFEIDTHEGGTRIALAFAYGARR